MTEVDIGPPASHSCQCLYTFCFTCSNLDPILKPFPKPAILPVQMIQTQWLHPMTHLSCPYYPGPIPI